MHLLADDETPRVESEFTARGLMNGVETLKRLLAVDLHIDPWRTTEESVGYFRDGFEGGELLDRQRRCHARILKVQGTFFFAGAGLGASIGGSFGAR